MVVAKENYPVDLKYHREHDWVRIEGGEAVFGITWKAQDMLGELVFFQPPQIGAAIDKDGSYGEVESVKAVSDLIAPLSGKVIVVNEKVQADPETVNDDPYGEGWLFIATPSNLKVDLEKMLFGQCNIAWIESEVNKLLGMLQTAAGVTLPSGGALVDDVYGNYPQLGWERLVHEFLHTT